MSVWFIFVSALFSVGSSLQTGAEIIDEHLANMRDCGSLFLETMAILAYVRVRIPEGFPDRPAVQTMVQAILSNHGPSVPSMQMYTKAGIDLFQGEFSNVVTAGAVLITMTEDFVAFFKQVTSRLCLGTPPLPVCDTVQLMANRWQHMQVRSNVLFAKLKRNAPRAIVAMKSASTSTTNAPVTSTVFLEDNWWDEPSTTRKSKAHKKRGNQIGKPSTSTSTESVTSSPKTETTTEQIIDFEFSKPEEETDGWELVSSAVRSKKRNETTQFSFHDRRRSSTERITSPSKIPERSQSFAPYRAALTGEQRLVKTSTSSDRIGTSATSTTTGISTGTTTKHKTGTTSRPTTEKTTKLLTKKSLGTTEPMTETPIGTTTATTTGKTAEPMTEKSSRTTEPMTETPTGTTTATTTGQTAEPMTEKSSGTTEPMAEKSSGTTEPMTEKSSGTTEPTSQSTTKPMTEKSSGTTEPTTQSTTKPSFSWNADVQPFVPVWRNGLPSADRLASRVSESVAGIEKSFNACYECLQVANDHPDAYSRTMRALWKIDRLRYLLAELQYDVDGIVGLAARRAVTTGAPSILE